MPFSRSCGWWSCQRRRPRWSVRRQLWIWPGLWLLRSWPRWRVRRQLRIWPGFWLWKWLWIWWWHRRQFQWQDHLYHHRVQEILPIKETGALQPSAASLPSPGVSASFTSTSTLLSWGSSYQCHLSARTWTLPSEFGSFFPFGLVIQLEWERCRLTLYLPSTEENPTRCLISRIIRVMCPLPAQRCLLPDPASHSTSGPNSSITGQQPTLQGRDKNP